MSPSFLYYDKPITGWEKVKEVLRDLGLKLIGHFNWWKHLVKEGKSPQEAFESILGPYDGVFPLCLA
jgi:DNA-directed RNA polymerase subunit N (RpoN/RPB10)